MTVTRIGYPTELPVKPDGFTRRMVMHMNFGERGGAATYECYFPDGSKAPFGWQYDTTPDGLNGFTIKHIDGALTWKQLVDIWPEWIKSNGKDFINLETIK